MGQGHRHGFQWGILGQNSQKTELLKTEIPGSCPLFFKIFRIFVKKKADNTQTDSIGPASLSLCSFQPTFFSGFWQKIFGF